MKISKLKIALFLFLALMGGAALAQPAMPKLVVGLVVDQMRWDYLYTYQWGEGGFKTLLTDGYRCNNTMIDYVPTITAVGHASLFTGTTPAFHGIAGNNFLLNGKAVASVTDPSVQAVGDSANASGKSPRNLITTTISDQLYLATDFKSRCVGIAIKDRAAILPAGHHPIGAYWYDSASKGFITSSYYMTQLPDWVKSFNVTHRPELSTDLGNLPTGTSMTFALAEAAIINENLGMNGTTDMLTVSVSNTDQCAHGYGSHSPEVDAIYKQLDIEIAHFIDVLDQRFGRNNYLLFVTADHGGTHSNARLAEHGLPNAAWSVSGARSAANEELYRQFGVENLINYDTGYWFYLNHHAIDSARLDRDKVAKVACESLQQPNEIEWAVDVTKIDTYPIPTILKERIKLGYYPGRSGEICVIPATGLCAGSIGGKGSNHGTWSQGDSHIPLIFMGWHVTPGETARLTHLTDIAATVCAMLHIQAPNGCIGESIFE